MTIGARGRLSRKALIAGLFLAAIAIGSLTVITLASGEDERSKRAAPPVDEVYRRVALALTRPGMIVHVTANVESDSDYRPVTEIEAWIDAENDRARVIRSNGDPRRPLRFERLLDGGNEYSAGNGSMHEAEIEGCRESAKRVISVYQTCLLDRARAAVSVESGRRFGDIDVIAVRTKAKYSGIDSTVTVSDELLVDAITYLPSVRRTNHHDSLGGGSRTKTETYFQHEFVARDSVPAHFFGQAALRPGNLDFALDQPLVAEPLYWLGPEYTWRDGIVPIALSNVRVTETGSSVRLEYVPIDDEFASPFVVITQASYVRSGTAPFDAVAPWAQSVCVEQRSLDVGPNTATIYAWSDACGAAPDRFAAELRTASAVITIEAPIAPSGNPYASSAALEAIVRALGRKQ